jgi:hypothetical protein
LYLLNGRISPSCAPIAGLTEKGDLTAVFKYQAAQKAGLVTITPDGPGFWKVETTDPKYAEFLKKARYGGLNGCSFVASGLFVAWKSVADITNIHEISGEKSEVEFTWKWELSPVGEKLVNGLDEQERARLGADLESRDHGKPDPTFSLVDMKQNSTPRSGKATLKKSGDNWIMDTSEQAPSPTASSSSSVPASGSSSSQPTDEQLRAGGISAEEIGLMKAAMGRNWHRSEVVDRMDDHKTVRFGISPKTDHIIPGAPELKVSCGKYLLVTVLAGPVANLDVRTKIDDGPVLAERWSWLKDDLISRTPETLARKLLKAKTFKFEFTPKGENPTVATFDMADLNEVFQKEPLCANKIK